MGASSPLSIESAVAGALWAAVFAVLALSRRPVYAELGRHEYRVLDY